MAKTPKHKPGPDPDRLVIEGNWKEAMASMLRSSNAPAPKSKAKKGKKGKK